jgi:DMSO/TMAO reductase YedYZ molybdopterin-dependent catalytic subunit
MSIRSRRLLSALVGVIAAIVTLGAAEVVSLFLGGIGSPLLSVGSLVIDLAPAGTKSIIVALFGTSDKEALAVILGVLVLVLAALAGLLQYRRPPFGVIVLGVVAAIAFVAVVTRADASMLSGAPVLVGAILGALMLRLLTIRLRAWAVPSRVAQLANGGVERRGFLRLVVVTGVVAVAAGIAARSVNAASQAARAVRAALTLPAPASEAVPVPAGAILDVEGISPYITSNQAFYRIDTALQVPSIDPNDWRLRITGLVENEVTIDYAELLALPLDERIITLACVSNTVGGDLIGNARWLGYPIRELLARAVPDATADMVLSRSIDGFTAGTPLSVLQDPSRDSLLAVGMNGEPLPLEHGFPVRMVVPGLFGYVSATKWVTELKVTRFADDEGYWTPRGWTALGPVKLASRIDTPHDRDTLDAGTVPIAGVAWCQHTGVSKVEVSIDDGAWREATLAEVATVDSWLQWSLPWEATPGDHDIRVRATDANGELQVEKVAPPAPDGSTGYHLVPVTVR